MEKSPLGEGAFGVVEKATLEDRTVVIKRVKFEEGTPLEQITQDLSREVGLMR